MSDCGTCPAFGYDCEYVAKVETQAAEIEELRAQLKTVLDREAETHRRHDAKVEAQAAEIERLIPVVKDALEKGRHRLLKEGFSPQDPTVRAMNDAIRALAQQEPKP